MSKPSWEDLHRQKAANEELDEKSIRAILGRIGDTPDGRLFREWLRVTKVHTAPPASDDDSALRADAADRRIALLFFKLLEPASERQDKQRKRTAKRS